MRVEVLGAGCARCNELYELAAEAIRTSATEAERFSGRSRWTVS